MIQLNEWFQQNTRRPLAIAAVMVLALWCSIVFVSYLDVTKNQGTVFSQLLNVTALALSQKNRTLIESVFQTVQMQNRSLSISVCQGTKTVLSSNVDQSSCHEENDFFTTNLREHLPGFSGYSLSMNFSRFGVAAEQVTLLLLGFAIVALTLGILRYVQRKFADEVVAPLKSGVLGDQPLQIAEFEGLRRAHHEMQIAQTSVAVADAVLSVTKQVSHDIRSPLSALNMIVSSLKELPEEKRLIIRNAAQRINDIANNLLQSGRKGFAENHTSSMTISPISEDKSTSVMLVALLDSILSEKRTQYRERLAIEIFGDLNQGYGLFARMDASEFSRVISNLINNSVEAISDSGRVTVAVRAFKESVSVVVSDNGKGIPAALLAQLGKKGATSGKDGAQSGFGLGVYHALKTIEAAGGIFSIQSQEGIGTMVQMNIPRVEAPGWFLQSLHLRQGEMVISIDDDKTIHQVWNDRLRSTVFPCGRFEHKAFSTPEQFENWYRSHSMARGTLLLDYEFLGQSTNGLDLVERLGLANHVVLVTSHFDESPVRDRAERLGLKILPKGLASLVPITVEST